MSSARVEAFLIILGMPNPLCLVGELMSLCVLKPINQFVICCKKLLSCFRGWNGLEVEWSYR